MIASLGGEASERSYMYDRTCDCDQFLGARDGTVLHGEDC